MNFAREMDRIRSLRTEFDSEDEYMSEPRPSTTLVAVVSGEAEGAMGRNGRLRVGRDLFTLEIDSKKRRKKRITLQICRCQRLIAKFWRNLATNCCKCRDAAVVGAEETGPPAGNFWRRRWPDSSEAERRPGK